MSNKLTQLNKNGDKRGMSLNSQKNLRGFQGIGNPKNNFAKKELSITRKQREMLPLPCPYAKGKTWLEWLAERGMALAGENATFYKELLDRLEGKVPQPIAGDKENPLQVNINAKSELLNAINRLAARAAEAEDSK
jgi:hypothetical protein